MTETTRLNPHEYSVKYHENHVIAIMPTTDDAISALDTLTQSGFLETEVTLTCGVQIADRIRASSGRSGVVGQVLQVVDQFGGAGEELEARHEYEKALREGKSNVLVLAPTEERKRLAGEILRKHGGNFINFFGRLTIEQLA